MEDFQRHCVSEPKKDFDWLKLSIGSHSESVDVGVGSTEAKRQKAASGTNVLPQERSNAVVAA